MRIVLLLLTSALYKTILASRKYTFLTNLHAPVILDDGGRGPFGIKD